MIFEIYNEDNFSEDKYSFILISKLKKLIYMNTNNKNCYNDFIPKNSIKFHKKKFLHYLSVI